MISSTVITYFTTCTNVCTNDNALPILFLLDFKSDCLFNQVNHFLVFRCDLSQMAHHVAPCEWHSCNCLVLSAVILAVATKGQPISSI